jgi:hypothetical protein
MAGISEKRVKVIVGTSRKSRKIGQHRISKTTQNQLFPNQRSQVTKMRYQNMPVHCQRSACFGLMFQLLLAFRARARPRKSHKTFSGSRSSKNSRSFRNSFTTSLTRPKIRCKYGGRTRLKSQGTRGAAETPFFGSGFVLAWRATA